MLWERARRYWRGERGDVPPEILLEGRVVVRRDLLANPLATLQRLKDSKIEQAVPDALRFDPAAVSLTPVREGRCHLQATLATDACLPTKVAGWVALEIEGEADLFHPRRGTPPVLAQPDQPCRISIVMTDLPPLSDGTRYRPVLVCDQRAAYYWQLQPYPGKAVCGVTGTRRQRQICPLPERQRPTNGSRLGHQPPIRAVIAVNEPISPQRRVARPRKAVRLRVSRLSRRSPRLPCRAVHAAGRAVRSGRRLSRARGGRRRWASHPAYAKDRRPRNSRGARYRPRGALIERAAGFPLRVITSTFETAAITVSSYDFVVSATAFHWVDPRVVMPKPGPPCVTTAGWRCGGLSSVTQHGLIPSMRPCCLS